jgi:CheY-like chemotaxis protein
MNAKTSQQVAKTGHILLVEDNPIHQELAYLMLRKFGHTVTLAENGVQALELLGKMRFDLVFMDCQLPEMDGFEATRRLRAGDGGVLDPNVTVIAITANAMEGDRAACLAAGMTDYLSKPFSVHHLRAMVDRYLRAPPALSDTPTAVQEKEALFETQWKTRFASLLNSVAKK